LRKGRVVDERFQSVRGVLVLLRTLSEGPASARQLAEALSEAGVQRDERTVRRWLGVMREERFGISRGSGHHELSSSPVRIAFGDYEALATLSVLESLAQREPVYGEYLASAVSKLREAIPVKALRFAESGKSSSPSNRRATLLRTLTSLIRSAELSTARKKPECSTTVSAPTPYAGEP
jgi:hypothetical protein